MIRSGKNLSAIMWRELNWTWRGLSLKSVYVWAEEIKLRTSIFTLVATYNERRIWRHRCPLIYICCINNNLQWYITWEEATSKAAPDQHGEPPDDDSEIKTGGNERNLTLFIIHDFKTWLLYMILKHGCYVMVGQWLQIIVKTRVKDSTRE